MSLFTQSKTFNADDHPPCSYKVPEYPGPTIPAAPVTALCTRASQPQGHEFQVTEENAAPCRWKQTSPAKDTINPHR